MNEKLENFIKQNRKICWESEYENGEYCIGENKVRQFVESNQVQAGVKPACGQCCKNCNAYEMTKEEHLENFCSRYCIRMDKLYSWDVNKNYCDQFMSKSV